MTTPLDSDQLALWHAFKRAAETVRTAVGEEITRATGLSDADYGILTRLDDAGGALRQQALASSLHWHRSRLSHQLRRMEGRGLLARSGAGPGVDVSITDAGRAAAAEARPVHADAVRRHLLDRVPAARRHELTTLLTAIGS